MNACLNKKATNSVFFFFFPFLSTVIVQWAPALDSLCSNTKDVSQKSMKKDLRSPIDNL